LAAAAVALLSSFLSLEDASVLQISASPKTILLSSDKVPRLFLGAGQDQAATARAERDKQLPADLR